jgi:hypothetical protein
MSEKNEHEQFSPDKFKEMLEQADNESTINHNVEGDSEEELSKKRKEEEKLRLIAEKKQKFNQKVNKSLGNRTKVNMHELPTLGKFYPAGAEIYIRELNVSEVRHWATINEENPVDLETHLNSVINSAVKFLDSSRRELPTDDICVDDRLYLILRIRELTFPDEETEIKIPVKCGCGNISSENSFALKSDLMDIKDGVEKIEKYYDEESRCYRVRTKKYGEMILHAPRIGMNENLYKYMERNEQMSKAYDKSIVLILPFLRRRWDDLDDKKTFDEFYKRFASWDIGRFNLYKKLTEMVMESNGIKQEVKVKCVCGKEVRTNYEFPDGIASIFTVSDVDSELD